MELWSVEGVYEYEDCILLGVYTTKYRAKSARERLRGDFDRVLIRNLEVNADYDSLGDKIRSGR